MFRILNKTTVNTIISFLICSCGQEQPAVVVGNQLQVELEPITFCTAAMQDFEQLACKTNGELLVSGNQLALLQADTSILFVDTKNASKRLVFSREQKSEVGVLGEILGLYSLTGDSLVLLISRGFILFTADGVMEVVDLGKHATPNYFFVSPGVTDRAIAFSAHKLYFLIGGEWDYPLKKYPSHMRFIFEYDLDSKVGKVLDFVNPDFGDDYQVLGMCNLSSTNGDLFVTYSPEQGVYQCDFDNEMLVPTAFVTPQMPSSPNDENNAAAQVGDAVRYSDFVEIDQNRIARIGLARSAIRTGAVQVGASGVNYRPVLQFFNRETGVEERVLSDFNLGKEALPFAQNGQLYLSSSCQSGDQNQRCYCFHQVGLN